jgi:hypothetical protein
VPFVNCPGCGREIPVYDGEWGTPFECAVCSTKFTPELAPEFPSEPPPSLPEPDPPPRRGAFWLAFGVVAAIPALVAVVWLISLAAGGSRAPSLSISSGELYRRYVEHPIEADREYQGRTLEVTGRVIGWGKTSDGAPYVVLEPPPRPPAIEDPEAMWNRIALAAVAGEKGVRCVLAPAQDEPSRDGPVSVVGVCRGKPDGCVQLTDCRISAPKVGR